MIVGKLLEEMYISCGLMVLRRAATGGSTTTVIDSGIKNKSGRGDGYYAKGNNGGHILFISQTTDRAAPEGQYSEVTDFTLSDSTPTFAISTVTAAVDAGDIYTVAKPTIQLYEMISRMNEGLRNLGVMEVSDVSLYGIANQTKYDLPAAITRSNFISLEIGSDTYGWVDAGGFDIFPKSGSTADQLIFTHQPPYDPGTPANQTFKIRYLDSHPVMSVYSDTIEKAIPNDLAIKVCAAAAWELLMRKRPGWYTDESKMALYQAIKNDATRAIQENPIRIKPANAIRRTTFGGL